MRRSHRCAHGMEDANRAHELKDPREDGTPILQRNLCDRGQSASLTGPAMFTAKFPGRGWQSVGCGDLGSPLTE